MAVPKPFDANDPSGTMDHSDRGPLFVAMSWALTALATVFLCLRVYCKLWTRRSLWWDDWILIAGWAMLIADDSLTTVLVEEFKLGRHSWDLEINNPVKFTLILSSRATVTITALAWTKTAFAVTLLRLTEGFKKRFVWFIIISVNIALGFSAAVPWIQCNPVAKGWDNSIPGKCWAPGVGTSIWIGTGAWSAFCDFALAALPWTFLWKLRMKKKEKIGVAVALSMGVIAGTVAIVKCCKLQDLNSPDAYDAVELYMWDLTESTATMMAACIPSLRVLIRDVREHSYHFRTSNLTYIKPSDSEKSRTNSEAVSQGPIYQGRTFPGMASHGAPNPGMPLAGGAYREEQEVQGVGFPRDTYHV